MAMRTASAEIHKRITAAAAIIGRGVRYNKPEMELEGRRLSAKAHIENQILMGRVYLSADDCQELAKMLFSTEPIDEADLNWQEIDADDDYTADATETNSEALARTPKARIDEDGDIDDEYDDEAEDL
ncbi:hypothetical protein SEA_GIBSON_105 [Streptomyces phage Gibson]|nr:hypothetical protein SEA_GIBSON_105 [Streptomyces phage Gibson]